MVFTSFLHENKDFRLYWGSSKVIFKSVSLKTLPYLTDLSPQLMACMQIVQCCRIFSCDDCKWFELCHEKSPSGCMRMVKRSRASEAQLDALSDWRPGGGGFNPCPGRQHSFVEIDREMFSTVILSLPLIQEGQLSLSGERNSQYWLTA